MHHRTNSIFKSLSGRKLIIILLILIALTASLIVLNSVKKTVNLRNYADQAVTQCQSDQTSRCYKSIVGTFAEKHQFSQTKKLLHELQLRDPQTKNCHTLSHVISIAEVKKDPENWTNAFSYLPKEECSYGYFHGVIEGKYIVDQDFQLTPDFLNQICSPMEGRSKRSCAHAFGHVVLTQENGELSSALNICAQTVADLIEPCYQGIFMENIQQQNLSFHFGISKPDWNERYLQHQTSLCNQYTDSKLTECWRSLAPVINSVTDNDPSQIILDCEQATTNSAKRACLRESFGQALISSFNNQSNQRATDFCSFSNLNQQQCITDLISYTLLTSRDYQEQLTTQFCPVLKTSENQQHCRAQIQTFD